MGNLAEKCCVCGSAIISGTLFRKGTYSLNELEVTEKILSRDCALGYYGKNIVEKMESVNGDKNNKKRIFKFDYCYP
jgi:hypothetical protein